MRPISKAEPQVAMKSRRRGDDSIQVVHHTIPSNVGNGQIRLQGGVNKPQIITTQHNQQQNMNRQHDNRSILTYDSHYAHLNPEPLERRESSASVASSIGSYDSGSTLTSDNMGDCAIMNRLRKSFEQKEEFLRRPSQPTGYISDTSPQPVIEENPASVKQREFYGRPQRLQKSIWPPNDNLNKNQENQNEPDYETIISPPPRRHHLQQNQHLLQPHHNTQTASLDRDYKIHQPRLQSPPATMPLQIRSTNIPQSAIKMANNIAREQFYNGAQQQQENQMDKNLDGFNSSMEMEDNWLEFLYI